MQQCLGSFACDRKKKLQCSSCKLSVAVKGAIACFVLPSWHVDSCGHRQGIQKKLKKKKKKKLDPLNQVVTQSPTADTGRDACITHSLNSLALKNTNICRIITGSINVMTKGVPPCFPPGHQRFSVLVPLNSNDSHVEHECVCVCVCVRAYLHSLLQSLGCGCVFFSTSFVFRMGSTSALDSIKC